jgi:Fe-S-cluster containining protein
LSVEQLVEFAAADAVDLEDEPESFADLREGRAVLILAHAMGKEGLGCIFLGESGCEVHDDRPRACRAYPFEFSDANRRRLQLHPQTMCPPETGAATTACRVPDEDDHAGELAREIDQRERETSEHALWLTHWNAHQRMRRKMRKLPQSRKELLARLLRGD